MRKLSEMREEIDRIDRQIVALFEARMDICHEVGEYKKKHELPVLDAARERELLEKKTLLVHDDTRKPYVAALFECIMASSRMLQERLTQEPTEGKMRSLQAYREMMAWSGNQLTEQRVLYQGQQGAYCEEAAISFFGSDSNRMNLKTWDGVFRAVRDGFGEYGVVPIENSSTGSILDVYDLLGQFGCYIVGEVIVRVEHCLMAPRGANINQIRNVYSHEQGFRQCRAFLEIHPQWNHNEMINTALAAKYVAQEGDCSKAAIASARAAELYDLQVLQSRINENARNYTRFIVVAAEPRFPIDADKISVVFRVPHTEGSLSRVLQVFSRAGLNLQKLESRPYSGENWQYDFYADFTGNLRKSEMELTIRELIEATDSFQVLGNYKAVSE